MSNRSTIVVVPRERFNMSIPSLDSVLAGTQSETPVIYVDGNSPRKIRHAIEDRSRRHGFEVIRSDRYLSPNEARNLGFAASSTEFVVFIDNDLVVTDGWLEELERCADETGAWAVGPLYLEGDPADRIVHMAGGYCRLDGLHGRRTFTTEHRFQGMHTDETPAPLVRERCDFVEFHCMLVRRQALDDVGPLDELLKATREHLDLCLRIDQAGGTVWFEPSAEVTYTTPPPVALPDIAFFLLRWSDDWVGSSLDAFVARHGLDPSYRDRISITRARRQVVFQPVTDRVRRIGGRGAERLARRVLGRVERVINPVLVRSLR